MNSKRFIEAAQNAETSIRLAELLHLADARVKELEAALALRCPQCDMVLLERTNIATASKHNEWLPIESAPHTGVAILLWQPWKSGRNCQVIGHYANGWVDRDCEELFVDPTYWMPLPGSPEKTR